MDTGTKADCVSGQSIDADEKDRESSYYSSGLQETAQDSAKAQDTEDTHRPPISPIVVLEGNGRLSVASTENEKKPEPLPPPSAPEEGGGGGGVEGEREEGEREEEDNDDDETQYPSGWGVALVIFALYLSGLLVAPDRTIIATAIPRITDQFHSLGDVGWYGSAYLLTGSAFQLLFGRLYTYHSPKWVFLIAIFIFEIGSAICGAAPNSIAFIIGRAVAGLGSAGIYAGIIIIIVYTVPLRQRPIYTGALGGIYGIASVAGPLLGGAFTNDVSWRWCFYINLPIGAVTIVILIFILDLPKSSELSAATGVKQKITRLDPLGTFLFVPGIVCLLLALQWGGTTYAWKDARIITLLVLFGVLNIAFVVVQIWKKKEALVPLHILKQRSIASGVFYSACVGGSLTLLVYYLPIWFQTIKEVSAVKSGIMSIPLLLGVFIASLLSGGLISLIGYYTPFMIAGTIVMSVGAGLLTTFTATGTNHPKWISYQVLYGLGTGLGFQQAALASQAVLPRKDMPTGSSLIFFAQSLGGAMSISIGGNIFTTQLVSGLAGIPGVNTATVLGSGASELRRIVPPKDIGAVLEAYNKGLTGAFKVGLVFACCSLVGALTMEWKSVKKGVPDRSRNQGGVA